MQNNGRNKLEKVHESKMFPLIYTLKRRQNILLTRGLFLEKTFKLYQFINLTTVIRNAIKKYEASLFCGCHILVT